MGNGKEMIKSEEAAVERGRQIPVIAPVVDIYENDDEILLNADMPGVAKENITININNGKLAISGSREVKTAGAASWEEFCDAEYMRTFSVPQTIDISKVSAEMKDGVLRLHLPKSEVAKSKQIVIH